MPRIDMLCVYPFIPPLYLYIRRSFMIYGNTLYDC